jgi:hypothetical protein
LPGVPFLITSQSLAKLDRLCYHIFEKGDARPWGGNEMFHINIKRGFVRRPAWITLEKALT